jgi:hypothetical protein
LGWRKARRASPLGFARAACLEGAAGVFAAPGGIALVVFWSGLCFAVDGFASAGAPPADACFVGEFGFGRNAAGRVRGPAAQSKGHELGLKARAPCFVLRAGVVA